jgi:hypothetical protein
MTAHSRSPTFYGRERTITAADGVSKRHATQVRSQHYSHPQRTEHSVRGERYFVSEASVYRLLKAHDLITSPAFSGMTAADEF